MDDSEDEDYVPEDEPEEEEDSKPAAVRRPSQKSAMTATMEDDPNNPPASLQTAPQGTASQTRKRKGVPQTANHPSWKRTLHPDEYFVEFHDNSNRIVGSHWGHDRLDRYISRPELDSLVGWATHTTNISKTSASINPLLGLTTSNTPMRPSLIQQLLQRPAAAILQRRDERQLEWSATYGIVSKRSFTSLQKQHTGSFTNSPLWECLTHSAAVALGILAEEMLTALLLPLARRHVQRCRDQSTRLVETDSIPSIADLERNHLIQQEWTLPPEEAIAPWRDHVTNALSPCYLVTSLPPTRSNIPGAAGTSMLNQPSTASHQSAALTAWHRRHDATPHPDRVPGWLVPPWPT